MTNYNADAYFGQSIAFNPGADVLSFGFGSASSVRLVADGADTIVQYDSQSVRLVGASYSSLTTSNFGFGNGSKVLLGAGNGAADTLLGSAEGDYIDIAHGNGGSDTVNADSGADVVFAGNTLTAADRISGGAGEDRLIVSGTYSSAVVLGSQTLSSIETIEFRAGTTISLQLNDTSVASTAFGRLTLDASALGSGDRLTLNGSSVTSGALSVLGGAGADVLTGGSQADLLKGNDGADSINGGAANDVIEGGLGGDTMNGGAGSDRFIFNLGLPRSDSSPVDASLIDKINGFEGAGAAGGDLIELPSYFNGLPLAFNDNPGGTAYNFTFTAIGQDGVQMNPDWVGDGFVDVLWKLNSAAGRVEVWVDGNDDGQFSEGDLLFHLNGVTSLIEADFVDQFPAWRGTQGSDSRSFNSQNNIVYGVGGNDTLSGLDGDDQIYGGAGNDVLSGDLGQDGLNGGADNDTLNGGDGSDALYGGAGSDSLNGGNDADTLYASYDTQLGWADEATSINRLNGDAGNDVLNGGNGQDILNGGADNDTLSGGENIDTLSGNDGADLLYGEGGNDSLNGGAGIDTINGGADKDTLTGGTEADTFMFMPGDSSLAAADRITDFTRTQGDKIDLSAYYWGGPLVFRGQVTGAYAAGTPLTGTSDLGAGFAQVWWIARSGGIALVIDTTGDGELSGNDFVVEINGITSLSASDFVNGTFTVLAGTSANDTNLTLSGPVTDLSDTIYGVGGNDTLSGLDGDDQIYGGAGNDVLSGDLGQDGLNGGADNDTLNGGDGSDALYGGAGSDSLNGGNDADTLYASYDTQLGWADEATSINRLNGDAGNDVLNGGNGQDILNGGADNDTLSGGENIDTLSGNDGADLLYGEGGNDSLNGGAGIDTINGGADKDTLTGGTEADTFMFMPGDSSLAAADRITDFTRTQGDKIDLSAYYWGGPLVFRGQVTGAYAAGTPLTGTSDLGAGFAQVWWIARSGGIALVIDTTGDGELSGNDFVVEINGITSLSASDFVNGTFTVLAGTSANDTNLTLSGPVTDLSDTIYGVGGNDTLSGLDGDDQIYGGAGNDVLSGDLGQDGLNGGADNDTLNGGDGSDALYGGAGSDSLNGGNDADTLYASYDTQLGWADEATSINRLNGDAGNDVLNGGNGQDILNGGADNDTLSGGENIDTLSGNDGADLLYGEGGNDSLNGGAGIDTINGGADKDTLTGGTEADTFMFMPGDSSLAAADRITDFTRTQGDKIDLSAYYWGGPLVFRGQVTGAYAAGTPLTGTSDLGAGFAQVWWIARSGGIALVIDTTGDGELSGNDFVVEINGITSLSASDFVNGTFTVLAGTSANDTNLTLSGPVTDLSDTIYGVGGNDTLSGLDGDDQIYGGAGNDVLSGDLGQDGLNGGADNDTLNGGDGSDALYGGAGSDSLNGGNDADTLYASYDTQLGWADEATSINRLNGDAGNDVLNGGNGQDILNGGADNDTLSGGENIDTLSGNDGADLLYGEGGNDSLNGGTLNDTLDGGSGTDTSYFAGARASYSITGNAVNATVSSTAEGVDTLKDVEFAQFSDGTYDFATGVFTPTGTPSPVGVTITGTAAADTISPLKTPTGQAKPTSNGDTLYGLAGDDSLDGGAGADTLYGGTGNDTYTVDNAGDQVIETAANGVDETGTEKVNASVSFTLGSFLENLTLTGTAAINGTGNGLNNTLTGNAAANVLTGGDGNDILSGAAGNDMLYGDAGADKLLGGDQNDLLYGGADKDTLDGGTGADTLYGGAGADIYTVDNAGDSIDETVGQTADDGALDTVNASVSFTLGGFLENLTLTGTAAINGTGNGLNNTLTGNAAANVLTGGDGNDILSGAAGNDMLYGDAGADKLLGGDQNDLLYGGADKDTLDGGTGADTLYGGAGADIYTVDNAGDSIDETVGQTADDGALDTVNASVSFTLGGFLENLTLTGTAAINGTGNGLNNTLTGNAAANVLTGGDGNDILSGAAGNDTLVGGLGKDTLTGGLNSDIFVFNAPAAGSIDAVKDFSTAQGDKIGIFASDYGLTLGNGLASNGSLDAGWFAVIAGSTNNQGTANHGQFLFNSTTKALMWDGDGLGGSAATVIATFSAGPSASTDFQVDPTLI